MQILGIALVSPVNGIQCVGQYKNLKRLSSS